MSTQNTRDYIGGGMIAAIAGVSPYATPFMAWQALVGEAPPLDDDTEEFFERRKSLEPYVRHQIKRRFGVELTAANVRYVHPKYPYFRAEIDAETADENFELKTVDPRRARDWGDELLEEYPIHVAAQIQWGLMIRPKPKARAVPCIGFDTLKGFAVKPDAELQEMLMEKAQRFWHDHVLPRVPPPITTLDDAKLRWPNSRAVVITAPKDIADRVANLAQLKERIKELEDEADNDKLELQKVLGDADTLVDSSGRVLCTWKKAKDSERFDAKALESAHPALYSQFLTTTTGSRRFLVK